MKNINYSSLNNNKLFKKNLTENFIYLIIVLIIVIICTKIKKIDIIASILLMPLLIIFFVSIINTIIYLINKLNVSREIKKYTYEIKKNNPYIYYQELPNNFSIGISSLLMNSNIEYEKDIIASILNLCAKKYLKISKLSDNNYNVAVLKQPDEKLLTDEKYLINNIIINNIKNIDYNEWYKMCLDEGVNLNLYNLPKQKDIGRTLLTFITRKTTTLIFGIISLLINLIYTFFINNNMYTNYLKTQKIILFFTICIAITIGLYIYTLYFAVIMVIVSTLVDSLITNFGSQKTNYFLKPTEKGKEELEKLLAFKNFLNDFGSFTDKDLEQVNLWEYYLSYATVFGLDKKILQKGYKEITNNGAFNIDSIDNINLSNLYLENKG
jgi:uncharacterized membrane protein